MLSIYIIYKSKNNHYHFSGITSEKQIVISGVSGRLPDCENVDEFWNALFVGANLLTEDDRRYPPGK